MNKYSKKLTHKHRPRSISRRDFRRIYGTSQEGYYEKHKPWAFFPKLVRDDPRKIPQCKFGNRIQRVRLHVFDYDKMIEGWKQEMEAWRQDEDNYPTE